jgi:hypothetical protein
MQVKTTTPCPEDRIHAVFIPILVCIIFVGCGNPAPASLPGLQATEMSRHPSGSSATLLALEERLFTVSADLDSASLVIGEIPITDGALLPNLPEPILTDRIDDIPAPAPDFGKNVGAVIGGRVHLLYSDRTKDDHRILKWLTRRTDGTWALDSLLPYGNPVALVEDEKGVPTAFWGTDALYAEAMDSPASIRTVLSPFSPSSVGCAAGNGFTVYDTISKRLIYVRISDAAVKIHEVPGGRPLHASTLGSDGMLAVATYDPDSKKIILIEMPSIGGPAKSTTVAICEGIHALSIFRISGGYAFVYDAIEPSVGKGTAYTVSLLAPNAGRYSRYVLHGDTHPLKGFSCVVSADTLYVLTMGDTLDLIRAVLP